MKKFAFIFSFLLCFCAKTPAQVTEYGYVREYNERQEKKPLSLVEIKVANAGTTTSLDDGSFLLQFRTLKAGDKVSLIRLYKEGYELFNKASVQQWNISNSGQPFELLMCSNKRFKEIYDRYAKVSYDSYAKQQREEERKLNEERKAGILKEREYRKKIKDLRDEYNKKLDNIDNYIDHFSRIDLTSLSENEADILENLQKGDIDSAIRLYDDMKLEEQLFICSNKISKTSTAITRLKNVQENNILERDSLYKIFLRSLDVLRLAGGTVNFTKIRNRMKAVADQDTSFTTAVYGYAQLASEQHLYTECEQYARIAENAFLKRKSDSLLYVYELMGMVEIDKVNYSKALEYFLKQLDFVRKNRNNCLGTDSIVILSHIASVYHRKGNFKKANEIYQDLMASAYHLVQSDSLQNYDMYEMLKNNYALFLRELGEYSKADSIWTSSIKYLNGRYQEDSTNYENLLMTVEINLALLRIGLGKKENVEDILMRWLGHTKKNTERAPIKSGDESFMIRNALIDYYIQTKEKEKIQHLVEDTERDYQKVMDSNPSFFIYRLLLTYQHAGTVLIEMRDYQNGAYFLQKALEGAYEHSFENPIIYIDLKIQVLNSLGNASAKIKKMELAENFYLKAIDETKKIELSSEDMFFSEVVYTYGNLGNLYYQQGKIELSEQYLKQFLVYVKNIPNKRELYGNLLIRALENMEDICLKKNRTEEALFYVGILIDIAEKDGNATRLSMYCLSASQLFWNMKDKKKARKWWKKAEEANPQYVAKRGIALQKLLFKK